MSCTANQHTGSLKFIVVDLDKAVPILGLGACKQYNLVQRVHRVNKVMVQGSRDSNNHATVSLPEAAQSIIDKYPDVFTGTGRLPGLHKIVLRENAQPSVSAPRKIPKALEDKVKAELKRMEKEKVIMKVTEPTS